MFDPIQYATDNPLIALAIAYIVWHYRAMWLPLISSAAASPTPPVTASGNAINPLAITLTKSLNDQDAGIDATIAHLAKELPAWAKAEIAKEAKP